MTEFLLAFSYKGHQPGETIEVVDSDVKNLVRHGVGKPTGSALTLHLGSAPELQAPAEASPEPEAAPKAARRTKKTSDEPEAAQEAAES